MQRVDTRGQFSSLLPWHRGKSPTRKLSGLSWHMLGVAPFRATDAPFRRFSSSTMRAAIIASLLCLCTLPRQCLPFFHFAAPSLSPNVGVLRRPSLGSHIPPRAVTTPRSLRVLACLAGERPEAELLAAFPGISSVCRVGSSTECSGLGLIAGSDIGEDDAIVVLPLSAAISTAPGEQAPEWLSTEAWNQLEWQVLLLAHC